MLIKNHLIPATAGIPMYPDGRMRPKAAADYLGLTEKGLAAMRSKGTGPEFIRVGGKKIFYKKESLDRFIEAGRSTKGESRIDAGNARSRTRNVTKSTGDDRNDSGGW